MSSIVPINGTDVHRLTSGQVIIDLSTAIKELIDNSIDAHASQVDISFKNYGVDSIECSDNGDGILSADFESLALKHYTSKISTFEDVYEVRTLGFRGEALSSLCSIGKLQVTTTTTPPVARKLDYDSRGTLCGNTVTSRNKGTTIKVTDLFHSLPVRRKEFIRTSKRQFTKCISLLQSYAMIQKDLQISVWNTTGNGRKSLVLSTKSSTRKDSDKKDKMLRNIVNIFGPTSVNGITKIHLTLDLTPFKDQIIKRYNIFSSRNEEEANDDDNNDLQDINQYIIQVNGYISKNSFGCGRTSRDRQFIYINKRPVEYPLITKCCNEVYRSFNNVQYPFVLLDFEVSPQSIDVNVTPDKRMVLLHNEQYIIDIFREVLSNFFEDQSLQLPKSSIQPSRELLRSQEIVNEFIKDEKESGDEKGNISEEEAKKEEEEYEDNEEDKDETQDITLLRPSKRIKIADKDPNSNSPENSQINSSPQEEEEGKEEEEEEEEEEEQSTIDEGDSYKEDDLIRASYSIENSNSKLSPIAKLQRFMNDNKDSSPIDHIRGGTISNRTNDIEESNVRMDIDGQEMEFRAKYSQEKDELVILDEEEGDKDQDEEETGGDIESEINDTHVSAMNSSMIAHNDEDSSYVEIGSPQEESNIRVSIPLSDSDLNRDLIHRSLSVDSGYKSNRDKERENTNSLGLRVSIDTDFSNNNNNNNNKEAFNEIQRIISRIQDEASFVNIKNENIEDDVNYLNLTVNKQEFEKMEIVGQFNLGFIIVTRKIDDNYDLFIVDQHASDEKYNFETLQKETIFKSQLLIVPQLIELSVIDELIVIDNFDIFTKNGFKIKIDEDNEPGRKVSLLSVPISRKTLFDINDFHELIQLIKDDGGLTNKHNIKCSKIRSMFAMRACRMSIMIGRPLTRRKMTKIVHNLSGLDKPWNCPHGRPTMRHLMELKDWNSFTDDYRI